MNLISLCSEGEKKVELFHSGSKCKKQNKLSSIIQLTIPLIFFSKINGIDPIPAGEICMQAC